MRDPNLQAPMYGVEAILVLASYASPQEALIDRQHID